MILEDTIVEKLINMDNKQNCLSVGQACQPINSGAKMSLSTYSDIQQYLCQLHQSVKDDILLKLIRPGMTTNGRSRIEQRNKVYVRLFTGQSAAKLLLKYQDLTEDFIREFKRKL